jgi:tyrosine-protein phosphatase OCA1
LRFAVIFLLSTNCFVVVSVGAVVGCLRKIQGWHLSSIFEEYRRFAGSKVRLQNEQFIELFDTDLVTIPVNPPPWLRKHM